jgi:hypothetical protein
MLKSAVLVLILAACTEPEHGESSRAQCVVARDHAIELQLAAAALPEDLAARHREAMIDALGSRYLDACVERGSEWSACVASAATPAAVSACEGVQP